MKALLGCMLLSSGSSLIVPSRMRTRPGLSSQQCRPTLGPLMSSVGRPRRDFRRLNSQKAETPAFYPSNQKKTWGSPRWAREMSVLSQCTTLVSLYLFHALVLSRHCLPFPVQLIPNNSGLFQSIGWDSLAGIGVTGGALWWKPWRNNPPTPPWRVDRKQRLKAVVVTLALAALHLGSGYLSEVFEYVLYGFVTLGVPMTVAMHRSLQVLLSHLAWVLAGSKLLQRSFKGFFGEPVNGKGESSSGPLVSSPAPAAAAPSPLAPSETEVVAAAEDAPDPQTATPAATALKDKWLSMKWRNTTWLWWAIGGYYASCWVFSCADVLNQLLLPDAVLDAQALAESVVEQMVNPEQNDKLAMAVASLAPCVSAPLWEEVLYRGFLLPTLSAFFPLPLSLPLSGLLFGLHHQIPASALPLSALGLAWALLYVLSRNLWVPVLVHAMWNSRVFLGSLLGV